MLNLHQIIMHVEGSIGLLLWCATDTDLLGMLKTLRNLTMDTSLQFPGLKFESWASQTWSVFVIYSTLTCNGLVLFLCSLIMMKTYKLQQLIMMVVNVMVDNLACYVIVGWKCHRVWMWRGYSFKTRETDPLLKNHNEPQVVVFCGSAFYAKFWRLSSVTI